VHKLTPTLILGGRSFKFWHLVCNTLFLYGFSVFSSVSPEKSRESTSKEDKPIPSNPLNIYHARLPSPSFHTIGPGTWNG